MRGVALLGERLVCLYASTQSRPQLRASVLLAKDKVTYSVLLVRHSVCNPHALNLRTLAKDKATTSVLLVRGAGNASTASWPKYT